MAGEIQLNSTTMATESSGSITAELDTIRPNTMNGSLTLQGDSSDAGVTGLTIDSSGVVNTTTAKVTNIQATSGQSLTIKDEDGNAAITIGTDNTAAGYLSLNFGSYHGDSGGAGSGTLSGNTLDDYEIGSFTPTFANFTIGNGSVFGSYIKVGKIVHLWYGLIFGSTSAITGTITSSGTAPFTAKVRGGTVNCYTPALGVIYDSGAGWNQIFSQMNDGTASLSYLIQPDNSAVTSTSPITWATNDSIMLQMTYEID